MNNIDNFDIKKLNANINTFRKGVEIERNIPFEIKDITEFKKNNVLVVVLHDKEIGVIRLNLKDFKKAYREREKYKR